MTGQDFKCIDVTDPKTGYVVYANYYWLCKDGDPKQALFYKGKFPQCNRDHRIIDMSLKTDFGYPVKCVLVPIAFLKRD